MIKDSHISYETRQRFFGQGKLKSKNFRGQVKLSDSEIYYTTYIISSSFAQILNSLTLIFRTKAMKIFQLITFFTNDQIHGENFMSGLF